MIEKRRVFKIKFERPFFNLPQKSSPLNVTFKPPPNFIEATKTPCAAVTTKA
jgi:hypothetical protein